MCMCLCALAEVCQQVGFEFIGALLSVHVAMKLLLTPVGPSDKVIAWIPSIPGFIPEKQHIQILACFDGKDVRSGLEIKRANVDWTYYKRLLGNLCKNNNTCVKTVSLQPISFFEPDTDFYEKLSRSDFFFMAGFTSLEKRVEDIYRRDDPRMTLKRMAVANRVATNNMAMWAVCGSAISCGISWPCKTFPARVLPNSLFQMLEVLGDGHVCYDACSGPHAIKVTDDLRDWHISSGTGIIVVLDKRTCEGKAFRCVKPHAYAYEQQCAVITAKTKLQLERLRSMVSRYRSDSNPDSPCWQLSWGTGLVEWVRSYRENNESTNPIPHATGLTGPKDQEIAYL